MKNKITYIVILLLVLFNLTAFSEIQPANTTPCNDCHLCNNPTTEEPCIRECLRKSHKTNMTKISDDIPDKIQLNKTGNLYKPVTFNHKEHAMMGNMSKGCLECHHYSSSYRIPPCRECHSSPSSLSQPGLKGAYHRQCMSCHKEWSHSTACVNCHEENNTPPDEKNGALKTVSTINNVEMPELKLYESSYQKAKMVTFYHKEHADLYGLSCVDCHKKENCINCHDSNTHITTTKSEEEIHGICNQCHEKDNCSKCHDKNQKESFTHNKSKWKLGAYHEGIACDNCHVTGQRISRFSGDCIDCHQFNQSKSFDHKVTGLVLDEIHAEFTCEDCHQQNKYHTSRDCSNCHDDDRTINSQVPGRFIEISFNINKKKEVN